MVFLCSFLALLAFSAVGDAFREAKDEEFPFQVSIQDSNRRHLCGGAIITPKWILTASSCLKSQLTAIVSYGSADSNNPLGSIESYRIEHQNSFSLRRRNGLALIQLREAVQFSKTAQQAKLPTSKAQLRNTTKLSGWKVSHSVDLPPNLYVSDTYFVVPKDCRKITGAPVALDVDEFCGMDEEERNILFNPGSIVSKSAIVLGILTDQPLAQSEPYIYVKISHNEQWIKEILQSDAQYINWVDEVPKNSASQFATSLTLIGIFTIFYASFSLNF